MNDIIVKFVCENWFAVPVIALVLTFLLLLVNISIKLNKITEELEVNGCNLRRIDIYTSAINDILNANMKNIKTSTEAINGKMCYMSRIKYDNIANNLEEVRERDEEQLKQLRKLNKLMKKISKD